jgi:hypothetical protein
MHREFDFPLEAGMDSMDTDHLNRSVTELGEPDALFRISRGRFLTKLVVGVTLLLIGLAANYVWWVAGPGQIEQHTLALLLGLLFTGAGLLLHMYRQRGLAILIYPTGLLRLRREEIDSFPWDDVEQVRLKVRRASEAEISRDSEGNIIACWLPADVPLFHLWNAGLSVSRGDGFEANFSAALSDFTRLAEEIQKRTFALQWPQIWERFLSGVPITFGDLELSHKGIKFVGKQVRWRDVKEMSVLQGRLRIKQEGKWFPSIMVDVYSIPNPHIFFALASEAQRVSQSR